MAQSNLLSVSERAMHAGLSKASPSMKHRVLIPLHAVKESRSAMDIMMGAQKLQILDHAERELSEYCSNLRSEKEREKCFEVVSYYHDKRDQATSGCANELAAKGEPGKSCTNLDNMQKLVYEVAYTGGAENLYHILRADAAAVKRRAAGTPSPRTEHDRLEELHTKAATLFEIVDTNSNGVIDREELLDAMNMLECKLSEDELGLVLSCMDCHGHITLGQFTDIVAAEALRKPDSDAEVLRHLRHSRPGWWSEVPAFIDQL